MAIFESEYSPKDGEPLDTCGFKIDDLVWYPAPRIVSKITGDESYPHTLLPGGEIADIKEVINTNGERKLVATVAYRLKSGRLGAQKIDILILRAINDEAKKQYSPKKIISEGE